jgi:signal peptidase II
LFAHNGFWVTQCVGVIVVTVTSVLAAYAWQRFCEGKKVIGETLILAGAISNIADRLWYGGVIDFIILSFHGYAWPTFNVADIAIVAGVVLMVYCDVSSKD